MKKLKTTALALGLVLLLAGTTTVRAQDYDDGYQDTYSNDANVSLQSFYDELSPYGTWIQDPQYGYVWRPDVDQRTFRPYYTEGRWAMTEYGNTWVSNYNWGWAPFHYGRWVYNNYRQWIWLPGTTWGPAWVDWRSGGGYYGWAPMGPSININISFGRRYRVPSYCWNFIPQHNIYSNSYSRYDYGRNNVYIRNTTVINNTYVYNNRTYYGGPSRSDVRRATDRDVTVYRVNTSSRPGVSRVDNSAVNIYRPRPARGGSNVNAAPSNYQRGSIASVTSSTTVRPERNGTTVNNNGDRSSNVTQNRGLSGQNSNREGGTNGRPARGTANNSIQDDRNVVDRNPNQQNRVSVPADQNSTRSSRNVDNSNQRANVEATDQKVRQRVERSQQADQRSAQDQALKTQQNAQAEQQRAQRSQQEQAQQRATQEQAQRQDQAQQRADRAQQQNVQRAQQEQAAQAQRQEQARQQQTQKAAERPQRVERVEAPRQEAPRQQAPARRAEAPTQRTESSSSGRPSRG